jgi:hypothetical protein
MLRKIQTIKINAPVSRGMKGTGRDGKFILIESLNYF